jgi:hypothetical protein
MKLSKLIWLITGILIAINLLIYSTHLGGDIVLMYVSDLLPVIASLVAFICLVKAYRTFVEFDLTKTAWLLIAIGLFLNFAAESTYAILEIIHHIDMNETYPTLADFFWCAAYIPLFAGIATMFVGYKNSGFPMGNFKTYTIFASLFAAVALSTIYFLLIPVINDRETELFQKIFYLFYPLADLILVVPAFILVYITSLFGKGIISKPLRYMAIGFVFITIADLAYSILSWRDAYGNGNFIDLAWHFGYLSIALAAAYQKELIDSLK